MEILALLVRFLLPGKDTMTMRPLLPQEHRFQNHRCHRIGRVEYYLSGLSLITSIEPSVAHVKLVLGWQHPKDPLVLSTGTLDHSSPSCPHQSTRLWRGAPDRGSRYYGLVLAPRPYARGRLLVALGAQRALLADAQPATVTHAERTHVVVLAPAQMPHLGVDRRQALPAERLDLRLLQLVVQAVGEVDHEQPAPIPHPGRVELQSYRHGPVEGAAILPAPADDDLSGIEHRPASCDKSSTLLDRAPSSAAGVRIQRRDFDSGAEKGSFISGLVETGVLCLLSFAVGPEGHYCHTAPVVYADDRVLGVVWLHHDKIGTQMCELPCRSVR